MGNTRGAFTGWLAASMMLGALLPLIVASPAHADTSPTITPGFGFGSTLSGSPTTVFGTAEDDGGVTRVRVAIRDRTNRKWLQDDGTWGSFNRFDATLSHHGDRRTAWSFEVSLPSGPFSLSARAYDGSGNSTSISPWHHFVVEASPPPVITPDFEFGETLTGSPTTLSGTVTSDTGIDRVAVAIRDRQFRGHRRWLQSDGSWGSFHRFDTVLSHSGAPSSMWSLQVNLPSGDYALSVRAWDLDGNTDSLSPWRHFTVIDDGPSLVELFPEGWECDPSTQPRLHCYTSVYVEDWNGAEYEAEFSLRYSERAGMWSWYGAVNGYPWFLPHTIQATVGGLPVTAGPHTFESEQYFREFTDPAAPPTLLVDSVVVDVAGPTEVPPSPDPLPIGVTLSKGDVLFVRFALDAPLPFPQLMNVVRPDFLGADGTLHVDCTIRLYDDKDQVLGSFRQNFGRGIAATFADPSRRVTSLADAEVDLSSYDDLTGMVSLEMNSDQDLTVESLRVFLGDFDNTGGSSRYPGMAGVVSVNSIPPPLP